MPKLVQSQLTVRGVAALNMPGHYADGRSLYLYVSPNGHKSWVLRYTLSGRRRDMGLGPVHRVSLADARKKATTAYTLIDQQIDPIDERNKRKAALNSPAIKRVLFDEVLDTWLRSQDHTGRHIQNVESPLLNYILPILGKLPVADITPKHVYGALTNKDKPLWALKTAPRALRNLVLIFELAKSRGWRTDPNPADLDQLKALGLKAIKHEVKHHASCPYQRIPEYWQRLQGSTDIRMLCLQWTVLNATRPQEARELEWDWINTEDKIVIIPGADMKGGRDHRIPYSDAAAELLAKMQAIRNGKFVFPSKYNKPYGRDVFPKMARQVMPGIDITAHGFRNSFTDWASEITIFEDEMVDIQLAHHIGNKVARAYRRGDRLDKRRDMMNAWAKFCQTGEIDELYRSRFAKEKKYA